MALSYANTAVIYRGPIITLYTEATFDNSYASGGETVNASDFWFGQILAIVPVAKDGYNVTYKKTDDKTGVLRVFASQTPDTNSATAAPLEGSVARDYSTVVAACIVYGR